ncbi:MAG: hypothetical protein KatS3mg035_1242 [Bacteroidia bacterium]|nr:MAG: hypothetical protein KatS3mg035_1242 [Bacteroidia bacterium]
MEKWEYAIRISQLPVGIHHYDFLITNSLKDKFESQLVNYFDVKAHVKLNKTSEFIEAHFQFKGNIGLTCDRCSIDYNFPIETSQKVLYTFRSISSHDDDEVIFLNPHTDYLDLSQEFYDFICLEIPQRKVPEDCPRENCPDFLIQEETEEIDPRWAELLKLKSKED